MGLNTAIATRVNGTPPPEVPIADIELGSLDFWALDDDVRDGAFATLRREAPISFWPTIELPGFVAGNGRGRSPSTTMSSTPAVIRTFSVRTPTSRSTTRHQS